MFIIKIFTIFALFLTNATAHMCASHDSSAEKQSYVDEIVIDESVDDSDDNEEDDSIEESLDEDTHEHHSEKD